MSKSGLGLQNKENTPKQMSTKDIESPQVHISIPESPRRNDDENSELDLSIIEKRPALPRWARSPFLSNQLKAQMSKDPDQIFQTTVKTCDLAAIFSKPAPQARQPRLRKRGHNVRSSSANWKEDILTWEEEIEYKKRMGFC
jgi:hypothetical protein